MAKQTINRGIAPNDNTGDTLRDGADKINSNFNDLYENLGDGDNLSFNVHTYTTSTQNLENKTLIAANNNIVINVNELNDVSIPIPAVDSQILEYNGTLNQWVVADRVGRHLVPSSNNTSDLGSPNYQFKDLYLSGETLYLGDIKLSSNNGEFKVESQSNPSAGGFKLSGLIDVSPTAPTNTQVLTWNASANTWYAANAAGVSGVASYLNGNLDTHIIPDTNAAYDIGSAEYKIRHLYLSDNSLWVGDDHKISVEEGEIKFKKLKRTAQHVPKVILDAAIAEGIGGDLDSVVAHALNWMNTQLDPNAIDLSDARIKIELWFKYAIQNITNFIVNFPTPGDLFPNVNDANYDNNDYEENVKLGQSTHIFDVTNANNTSYLFTDLGNIWFPTSTPNPTLYLRRGEIYNFRINASGHPFRIQNSSVDSDLDAVATSGIVGNTTESGTLVFKVPMETPSTLYYRCTVHSVMSGTINIV